jgi:alkylhydroperoxidase family enzyme
LLTADGVAACDQEVLLATLSDVSADLSHFGAADRALIAYADKLTRDPGGMSAADVAALRQAGFDDRSIHDACAIVAYFAFVNRIADGLGVELEESTDVSRRV